MLHLCEHTKGVEVIGLDKRKNRPLSELREDEKGLVTVQNQLIQSYQSGVIEDKLHNNRGTHTYNIQK